MGNEKELLIPIELVTIKRWFKKLKLCNLIKTKPQGFGLPQKIYLCDTYFLSKIRER